MVPEASCLSRPILYLVTEDWFFASHFLPTAQAARDCGLEVVVATRVGADGERLRAVGLRVIAVDIERGSVSLLRGFGEFVQAFRIVRRERPDVVHCIALRSVVIGGLAAKLAGARQLVLAPTGLGQLWLNRGSLAGFVRSIVRAVVGSWLRGRRTRYVFENRDDPREFGLNPESPQVVIVGGAGVDPALFPARPEPPVPPFKVAVVARMISPKGIAEAVAAAQRVRAGGAPMNWTCTESLIHEPAFVTGRGAARVVEAFGDRFAWPRRRRGRGLATTSRSAAFCPIAKVCRAPWSKRRRRAVPSWPPM